MYLCFWANDNKCLYLPRGGPLPHTCHYLEPTVLLTLLFLCVTNIVCTNLLYRVWTLGRGWKKDSMEHKTEYLYCVCQCIILLSMAVKCVQSYFSYAISAFGKSAALMISKQLVKQLLLEFWGLLLLVLSIPKVVDWFECLYLQYLLENTFRCFLISGRMHASIIGCRTGREVMLVMMMKLLHNEKLSEFFTSTSTIRISRGIQVIMWDISMTPNTRNSWSCFWYFSWFSLVLRLW